MEYLVKPEGWDTSPWYDTFNFYLYVTCRDDVGKEWAVCTSHKQYGFTKAGKYVALRGVAKVNRRHAVFDLPTALKLAEDMVEGRVRSDHYRVLKDELVRYKQQHAGVS